MTAASVRPADTAPAGTARLGVWPFNRRLIAYAAGPFAAHAVLQISPRVRANQNRAQTPALLKPKLPPRKLRWMH